MKVALRCFFFFFVSRLERSRKDIQLTVSSLSGYLHLSHVLAMWNRDKNVTLSHVSVRVSDFRFIYLIFAVRLSSLDRQSISLQIITQLSVWNFDWGFVSKHTFCLIKWSRILQFRHLARANRYFAGSLSRQNNIKTKLILSCQNR